MIMFDHYSWPTISVAITVDNDRLVPVSVTVPITIDDDGFVAIAVQISSSMDRYAARSYSNTNIVSQSRRNGANARNGEYKTPVTPCPKQLQNVFANSFERRSLHTGEVVVQSLQRPPSKPLKYFEDFDSLDLCRSARQ
jgi:hypothetical protein